MNQIQRSFHQRANSYERNNADAPIVNPAATQLASVKGNPGFAAQFDIQFLLKYFTLVDATGVFTASTAAAIFAAVPALGTQLAAFLYGNSDFAAGFRRLQQAFPVTGGWVYGDPAIYGKNLIRINGSFIDANVAAVLQRGDLVIPYYYDAGATTYVALMIVRCTQVGYGTLLDSLNSDMFIQNMVRYIMSDTTAVGLAQYNNNIYVMRQSLFGKFDSDFVSPNSFKMPEQFQAGIIDVPIKKAVDKSVALATYVNYDAVTVQWSLFVEYVQKQSL
jgi:hypothetical protein